MRGVPLDLVYATALVVLPLIPAVILFKLIPSKGEVSGPLKGMTVKYGGAFAGYLPVFLFLLKALPFGADRYVTYTVSGKVVFDRAPDEMGPDAHDIRVRLTPPRLDVDPDGPNGQFSFDVPVPIGKDGRPAFPSLALDLPGYEPRLLPLAPNDVGDGSRIEARRDPNSPYHIGFDPITLRSRSKSATYDETTAQQPMAPSGTVR
jgi:hypothetical protein